MEEVKSKKKRKRSIPKEKLESVKKLTDQERDYAIKTLKERAQTLERQMAGMSNFVGRLIEINLSQLEKDPEPIPEEPTHWNAKRLTEELEFIAEQERERHRNMATVAKEERDAVLPGYEDDVPIFTPATPVSLYQRISQWWQRKVAYICNKS